MKDPNNPEKWMSCPRIDTEHPGLAYFCPLNELIVAKKLDALHKVIGKKGIGYTIFNNEGQKIFLAVREKSCRRFQVKIFNYYGNEVIEIKKPKYCVNKVHVWAPPGNFVGYVKQVNPCANTFLVKNREKQVVLKIKAPCFFGGVYDVLSRDELVGTMKKQWNVEALVNYDNFGVSFPVEMEVGDKAVLLGACFLIGYLKY
ncbi:phospholipid scramblase 1-like [Ostrinia furnacalis]|uniref:phospholipid scramblase 1-like n=1 Tax=Ostrinia furnacalis TaxID=93504 RepID=UPI00103F2988|nr:phospholipid scramblase 1-like [Ostrinia furnacalis]